MRVALIGSADFGKATLEAFLDRGDEVVAVFCPPDNPKSSKPEVLKEATIARGLSPLQFSSLKSPEAAQALIDSKADICVMAYVLQFVPQELVKIPRHGTIQYHPSLLPQYRGPSAINWAIALGEEKTGLTILFYLGYRNLRPHLDRSEVDQWLFFQFHSFRHILETHQRLTLLCQVCLQYSQLLEPFQT